jgi:flagellin-specific chaperone FliS
MKFPEKRNYKLDFESALSELYLIHKDLKNQLTDDESFNDYMSYLFEFAYQKILDKNNLKDTDVIREQFSIILAQEVNDLYESEYVVPNSTSTKNIIKDFISDKNIYFYMDDNTKEGIEFFIIKKHELDTLNYLGLEDYYFIDTKPERFVQGW